MSLAGAFLFLIIGVIEVLAVQKLVYPALRWKYEEAKVTGTQRRDPANFVRLMWVLGLVVMPLLGLFFGKPLAASIGLE
jgi:hypothetical protein